MPAAAAARRASRAGRPRRRLPAIGPAGLRRVAAADAPAADPGRRLGLRRRARGLRRRRARPAPPRGQRIGARAAGQPVQHDAAADVRPVPAGHGHAGPDVRLDAPRADGGDPRGARPAARAVPGAPGAEGGAGPVPGRQAPADPPAQPAAAAVPIADRSRPRRLRPTGPPCRPGRAPSAEVHATPPPAVAAGPRRAGRPQPRLAAAARPNLPTRAASARGPAPGPASPRRRRPGTVGAPGAAGSPQDAVSWIHQRIASIQQERETRWQKIIKILPGMS